MHRLGIAWLVWLLSGCSSAPNGKTPDSAAADAAAVAPDLAAADLAAARDLGSGGADAPADVAAGADVRADMATGADAGSPSDPSRPDARGGDAPREAPPGADASIAPDAPSDAGPDAPPPAPDGPALDQGSVDQGGDGPAARCGRIGCDCTFRGIRLWGRVKYVGASGFPDIKVKETPFPDLRVRETTFPLRCGEWQVVDTVPDFTVQKVDFFEDFAIQHSPFPGVAMP